MFILDSDIKIYDINVSEENVIVLEPSMTKFIDLEKTYDAIDFERPVPTPLFDMIKLKENNEKTPEKLYYYLDRSFTQIKWFIYLFKHEELFNSEEVERFK